jgi:hypothetical protein
MVARATVEDKFAHCVQCNERSYFPLCGKCTSKLLFRVQELEKEISSNNKSIPCNHYWVPFTCSTSVSSYIEFFGVTCEICGKFISKDNLSSYLNELETNENL